MSRHYALWSIVVTSIMVFGTVAGFATAASGATAPTQVSAPPHSISAPGSHPVNPYSTGATGHPLNFPGMAQRSAMQLAAQKSFLASHTSPRFYYPPNFMGGATVKNGVVTPLYAVNPNPVGLGDLGVLNTTGTPTPFVSDSTSWEGVTTVNSANIAYLANDGPDVFGGQLNTVLTNVTVFGSSNTYWIQDVYGYEVSTGLFYVVSNIWNFTSPTAGMPASTFASQTGFPSGSYYYNFTYLPSMALPLTINLWDNTSMVNFTAGNPLFGGKIYEDTRVDFGIQVISAGATLVGNSHWDRAIFNSTALPTPLVHKALYQVNGARVTPTGYIPYDSEITICGPGGGSSVDFNAFNGTMQLNELVGTAYVPASSVIDSGSETGETASGLAEHYTTPGTVIVEGGPSLVMPLWGATPGPAGHPTWGNIGTLHITGTLAPDNAFLFMNRGTANSLQNNSWAPVLPGGHYAYNLPPGYYSGMALMSFFNPQTNLWWDGASSVVNTTNIALTANLAQGIYTPLFAFNNFQLGNLSVASGGGGLGTSASPYMIMGFQSQLIWPEFGELNDFLFQVFPGVFIAYTTAYVDLSGFPALEVTYAGTTYANVLANAGLPLDNDLQIQVFWASNVWIMGDANLGGWTVGPYQGNGAGGSYYPVASIVLWQAVSCVVVGNTFLDQGWGLQLLNQTTTLSGNLVYGNIFTFGITTPNEFPFQTAIIENEPGDTIVNNWFGTIAGASSPNGNFYSGGHQTNLDTWSLPFPVPANLPVTIGALSLTPGSVAGNPWVCGNYWGGAYAPYQSASSGAWATTLVPSSTVPYADLNSATGTGIANGADNCPTGPYGMQTYTTTYTESGLSTGRWTITDGAQTLSASAGSSITVQDPNGSWLYSVTAETGMTATPSAGTNAVAGAAHSIAIVFATPPPPVRPTYEVSVAETGLPAGTAWSIVLNGSTTVPSVNGASVISWTETDGTYSYTTNSVSGYTIQSGGSGTLVVNGGATSATTVFQANSETVTVTVTNAAAVGSGLKVSIAGTAITGTSGTFTASSAPGIVSVEVSAPGYIPYYTNLTVVEGTAPTLTVTLAAVPVGPGVPYAKDVWQNNGSSTSGGLTSSGGIEGIVIGLVIGLVVGLAVAMMMRKKSPPAGSGAPQWNSGSADAAANPPPPAQGAPPPPPR